MIQPDAHAVHPQPEYLEAACLECVILQRMKSNAMRHSGSIADVPCGTVYGSIPDVPQLKSLSLALHWYFSSEPLLDGNLQPLKAVPAAT